MKVLFLPEVRYYFQELVDILFKKEYFSFEESAVNYVRELILDIQNTLPSKASKIAPPYFNRYGKGMYYTNFRKNKTTQWYVFFTKYKENGETIYVVRYISNNHIISQFL